jgi:hypothetical protein
MLNCAPSADAVAGNGRPLSWAPSADAVAGGGNDPWLHSESVSLTPPASCAGVSGVASAHWQSVEYRQKSTRYRGAPQQ